MHRCNTEYYGPCEAAILRQVRQEVRGHRPAGRGEGGDTSRASSRERSRKRLREGGAEDVCGISSSQALVTCSADPTDGELASAASAPSCLTVELGHHRIVMQQQANAADTKNNIAQKQMLLANLPDSDPRKQTLIDLLYNDIMQQGK
mmetsp:Transcript_12014/g.21633  ORF Transcript_12014/g.21633 Transcript_12014/m.21633 type:complete len:148 (+) Transcript_12014:1278-1721(+)